MSPYFKLALDFGPLAVFFLFYKLTDIMTATVALVAATLICLAVSYAKERKVSPMPVITAVIVSIFGGLTIWLNDDTFIKIKPTIINLLSAALLLGGVLVKRPALKYLCGAAFPLTDEGWRILTLRWGIFFVFLAGLNEVIWRNFSMDFWVDFKVFGMLTLTMLFTFAQVPLLNRYAVEEEKPPSGDAV